METIEQQIEFLKRFDIERLARGAREIYEEVKGLYEPQENGKYLAIISESRQAYFGETGIAAANLAHAEHPDRIAHIMRIGYTTPEMQVKSYMEDLNIHDPWHFHQEHPVYTSNDLVAQE